MKEPQEIIVVDAFTDRPFAGNPAAVCVMFVAPPPSILTAMTPVAAIGYQRSKSVTFPVVVKVNDGGSVVVIRMMDPPHDGEPE